MLYNECTDGTRFILNGVRYKVDADNLDRPGKFCIGIEDDEEAADVLVTPQGYIMQWHYNSMAPAQSGWLATPYTVADARLLP